MFSKISFKQKLTFILALMVLMPIIVLSSFNIYQFKKMNADAIENAKTGIRNEAEKVLKLGAQAAKNDIEIIVNKVEENAAELSKSENLLRYIATSQGKINKMDKAVLERITVVADSIADSCVTNIKLINQTVNDKAKKEAAIKKAKEIIAENIVNIKIGEKGYAYVINSEGDTLIHPNKNSVGVNAIKDRNLVQFKPMLKNRSQSKVNFINYQYKGAEKFVAYKHVKDWDWIVCVSGNWGELAEEASTFLFSEIKNLWANTTVSIKNSKKRIISDIKLIDPKGNVLFNFYKGRVDFKKKNIKNLAWFKTGINKTELYNTGAIIPEGSQSTDLIVSVPIYSGNEKFGLIAFKMDWGLIWEKLSEYKYGKSGYVSLTNENTIIVSHPKYGLKDKVDISNPKFGVLAKIAVNQLKPGKIGIQRYTFEGVEKLLAHHPVIIGGKIYSVAANTPVKEFLTSISKLELMASEKINDLLKILITGSIVFSIAGILTGLIFSAKISGKLLNIVDSLKNGSQQLYSASEQISESSQQLAEGASEQAASVEETSSSLEELSSMTRQNSENAGEADSIMKETISKMQLAEKDMGELTESMMSISKSSEETSKIIKTIDEIAFQTNLLALNAAVEAARAGEAGAGFAVVADEVRNLAMRAANAAKNTSEIIEKTVHKIHTGSTLAEKTNSSFEELRNNSKKVNELISEIAAASKEQAEGIKQVSSASNQMDNITQVNAANAEESASASEELNAQAQQMKSIVESLVVIINGQKNMQNNESQGYIEQRSSNQKKISAISQRQIHKEKNNFKSELKRPDKRLLSGNDDSGSEF